METVERYIGNHVNHDTSAIYEKGQQRLYFLHSLNHFNVKTCEQINLHTAAFFGSHVRQFHWKTHSILHPLPEDFVLLSSGLLLKLTGPFSFLAHCIYSEDEDNPNPEFKTFWQINKKLKTEISQEHKYLE